MSQFLKELDKRVNPEKTRNFDINVLSEKIERLMDIGKKKIFETPINTLRIGVIGSNGKGSTSILLSRMLKEKNIIGLYTSPHLISPLERIRVNDKTLDIDVIENAYFEMLGVMNENDNFSYFEIMTLLALYVFNENKCNIQIFEAGMGGRFDATKIARPEIVVLTGVSLEHTQILGSTIKEILSEKLAIIGSYTKKLFYPDCKELNQEDVELIAKYFNENILIFKFEGTNASLRNNYIKYNYEFAKYVLDTIEIDCSEKNQIDFSISGRMEMRQFITKNKKLKCIYDNAHNPEAISILFSNLKNQNLIPKDRTAVFMGMLHDKDIEECIKIIKKENINNLFLITGEEFSDSSAVMKKIGIQNLKESIKNLVDDNQIDTLLITGSSRLYGIFLDLTK